MKSLNQSPSAPFEGAALQKESPKASNPFSPEGFSAHLSTAAFSPRLRITTREALACYRAVRPELAEFRKGEVSAEQLTEGAQLVLLALPSFKDAHGWSPAAKEEALAKETASLPILLEVGLDLVAKKLQADASKEDKLLTKSLGWHLAQIAGRTVGTVAATAIVIAAGVQLHPLVSHQNAFTVSAAVFVFGGCSVYKSFSTFIQAGATRSYFAARLRKAVNGEALSVEEETGEAT